MQLHCPQIACPINLLSHSTGKISTLESAFSAREKKIIKSYTDLVSLKVCQLQAQQDLQWCLGIFSTIPVQLPFPLITATIKIFSNPFKPISLLPLKPSTADKIETITWKLPQYSATIPVHTYPLLLFLLQKGQNFSPCLRIMKSLEFSIPIIFPIMQAGLQVFLSYIGSLSLSASSQSHLVFQLPPYFSHCFTTSLL